MGRAGAFKDRPLWRRLQTIHHEIKEHRFPNASTLARMLSVSTKTVQRDLDYLRDELDAPILRANAQAAVQSGIITDIRRERIRRPL